MIERLKPPPRRALVGGALVAVAAIGVFTAHRGAGAEPDQRYVVAAKQIEAGSRIERSDLGSIALDLPRGLKAIPVEDATKMIGRVASDTIGELELLSERDVLAVEHFVRPDAVQLAIDIPAARALAGIATTGDVVSVLSTDPQGAGTIELTDDALVTSIEAGARDAIGSSGTVRVVLNVRGGDIASEIVDAAVRSEISLLLPENSLETSSGPARSTDEGKP